MRSIRRSRAVVVLVALALGVTACTGEPSSSGGSAGTGSAGHGGAGGDAGADPSATSGPPGTVVSIDPAREVELVAAVERSMADQHLKAAIVKVTVDGDTVLERAWGESNTGVPATTEMHFRNGAVAISYMSTLLLTLVDDGIVSLDDKVSEYRPDITHADAVTLGQLAQMTSGYQDYVQNPELGDGINADPFRFWSTEDQLRMGADLPLLFEPGTNWGYAHTNYVVLSLALEAATGEGIEDLLQERVLDPMGLTGTVASLTADIPPPALQGYSAERRQALGIPAGTPFLETTTGWNPSWTLNHGAIQTSTIDDYDRSAIAIGTGTLLSPESYQAMISTDLRGFGQAQEGCPTCFTQSEGYAYGLGIVTSGDWVLQNPLFAGYASTMAYLPPEGIAISVAVTFDEAAFDETGAYVGRNAAQLLFIDLGAIMAPDDAPPRPPGS